MPQRTVYRIHECTRRARQVQGPPFGLLAVATFGTRLAPLQGPAWRIVGLSN